MKTKVQIFIVFLSITLSSCYQQPEIIKIQSFDINRSNETTQITLGVEINNPNFYKLKINEIDLKIFINDIKAGNVKHIQTIEIPANFKGYIKIPTSLEVDNIIQSGIALASIIKSKEINLALKGKVKVKAVFYTRELDIDKHNKIEL